MKPSASLLVICAAALCASCATRSIPSKLYNLKSGEVVTASFEWSGTYSGPVILARQDESCSGEYRTIQEGRDTVGFGASGGPWGILFASMYSGTSVERAQKGVAIAVCPSKVTFECEYITNVGFSGVSGHGACKDNRGEAYRLMF